MNLAIMLAGRRPADRETIAGLVGAAVPLGHVVRLFLLGDGVLEVDFGSEMAGLGAQVSLCEADAAVRGLHKTGQPGVFFGSLYDWARIVEDCDRLLGFASA
jgi:sulfur relay (sulfurtransferase) complex TusBCD TusD component (DsrE family)